MGSSYEHICVALDVDNPGDAITFVNKIREFPIWVKVGITLWNMRGGGYGLVEQLLSINPNLKIFLDLKLNDIPFQMQGALRALEGLGVKYVSIHGGSGARHIHECVPVANELGIGLLAITVLTSISEKENKQSGAKQGVKQTVIKRAKFSARAGAAGIVSSALEVHELQFLKEEYPNLKLVTPAVRPWPSDDDQRRSMHPVDAIRAGSDMLVIGRPIRNPPESIGSPISALHAIAAMVNPYVTDVMM